VADRTAVVTGASQGIGLAIAESLSRAGFLVIGVDLVPCAHLHGCQCLVGDVSDISVLRAADMAAAAAGTLVCWVSNAANPSIEPLHRATAETTDAVFDVGLKAVFWGSALAVRRFIRQETGGSIVNVSSIQATHAFPGWAAYVTAKGGVDALTRYIAVEYGPLGIRANSVAPGNIMTGLLRGVIDGAEDPELLEHVAADLHPLGRVGLPRDVAELVTFLSGPDSSFISGQSIAVDGGATARCFQMPVDAEVASALAKRRAVAT
jgi:NAD(P)-dependent dehydrogenase (short-subunit alcohol dehydrogenase family)